jgi:hypothetical protein
VKISGSIDFCFEVRNVGSGLLRTIRDDDKVMKNGS